MASPLLETSNTLNHPTGPDYQLQLSEGTYILRDDLHLATPPPHPSEAPVINPNPLATNPIPPTAGVKLSVVCLSPPKSPPQLYKVETTASITSNFATFSIKESEKESQGSGELASDGSIAPLSSKENLSLSSSAPAFGEGNTMLQANGKEFKRKKPKNNIVKSNSSFVSRVIPHESLSKRLQERSLEGLYAFANVNRAFQWLDLSSTTHKSEPLTKILFTKAHMLCHDTNDITKTTNHIDIVMGSSAADIIWYEPMTQKYARINKNGVINSTPVSDIQWIPGSENLFLAAHMDGSLVVYEKEKEDATFLPEHSASESLSDHDITRDSSSFHVYKSVNSKNQKTNPVAFWKLSNQRINAFAFSPDSRHLAVVSEDGALRIIDYLKERLTDIYRSYYGGLICVCWSPDGKYVLTGGQDDLVSIWSLAERQIVARCPGHHSWVTAVSFDPWRCDHRTYRFGSVGEDCRLLLWDFSVGMLHRPKAASVRQRGSISSHKPMARQRTASESASRLRSNSNLTSQDVDGEDIIQHPVEPRARTAELPPVMSKAIDDHPLSWLKFEADCIITTCAQEVPDLKRLILGHIRTWDRPKERAESKSVDGVDDNAEAGGGLGGAEQEL
ncbi:MAG: hypothetical protein M1834_009440 [Cirrosporium novae-zelandiae]|nr:MAG: hypothetical protein M1834_009440 [Cirrosporium novae-zelandiae]